MSIVPNFRFPEPVGNAHGTGKQIKKTEQKGTNDEIAIRNEESTPFPATGYFVVCPFLAAYTKRSSKQVPDGIPKNH
jgi:hypothetical protein